MKTCFKKKSKKAFTLIELSIVLLVLAFLVGGVLVSKKIIDNAKAQSVITELDQMRKSVQLFSANFGALPGDISLKELEEFAEFKGKYDVATNKYVGFGTNSYAYSDNNYIENIEGIHALRQLELSGFISGVPNANIGGSLSTPGSKNPETFCLNVITDNGLTNIKPVKNLGNVGIGLSNSGLMRSDLGSTMIDSDVSATCNSMISIASGGYSIFNELASTSADRALSTNEKYYLGNFVFIVSTKDLSKMTAFTSTMAKIIDQKIDDGKPYSGELVAGMVAYGRDVVSATSKNYCTMLFGKDSGAGIITSADVTAAAAESPPKTLTVNDPKPLTKDCIADFSCTIANFQNANKYQTSAPDSLIQGCNLFYKLIK